MCGQSREFMKNNIDNEILKKIKNILLKKSEGYFYSEEVLEYQSKTDIQNKENQLNFFDEDNNETKSIQEPENLALVKKKVTTHYVPPDLLAIKMLAEIFGEKVDNDELSRLSDLELNKVKQDILKKLEEI